MRGFEGASIAGHTLKSKKQAEQSAAVEFLRIHWTTLKVALDEDEDEDEDEEDFTDWWRNQWGQRFTLIGGSVLRSEMRTEMMKDSFQLSWGVESKEGWGATMMIDEFLAAEEGRGRWLAPCL
jgi:hypothetical protein